MEYKVEHSRKTFNTLDNFMEMLNNIESITENHFHKQTDECILKTCDEHEINLAELITDLREKINYLYGATTMKVEEDIVIEI